MRKVLAKINLKYIQQNAESFKRLTKTRLCAVVKADAYGHGAEETVCALSGVADAFAVSLLDEAKAIRTAACGKDILILTPPLCEDEAREAIWNGFVLTVSDLWTARLVVQTAKRLGIAARVHLKTNTGMNRYGMNGSMLGRVCTYLQRKPNVRVEGLYSHIYDYTLETARRQREIFLRMQKICHRYFPQAHCHLSATYGALLGEDFAFDMVRVGIGLYGYLPDGAKDVEKTAAALELKKAMTVETVVAVSRKYAGGGTGYGAVSADAERFQGKRLAVCRVGYADGFLRKKDNGVCGAESNAGATCMDACIRFENGRRGKRVPVLANAAETAEKTGTISYEVLCAATRRAEVIYEYE